ncbi:hypothetical protein EDB80DRAFT_880555 [Ilyonectria destructans]|nr:hypothetical protein EDB80DRAFT_880555 [Ilyonectria destructans]
MSTLCTLILALVGISMAIPNPHNYISNAQCPAGCDAIVAESQDPDPHQLHFFQRMTDPNQCGSDGGREITKSEGEGQSIGIHSGISGAGWISVGFDVSEYVEPG